MCLTTNRHFWACRPGLTGLHELADEMRGLLERYPCHVEERGEASVRELAVGHKGPCALPNGNVGMLSLQRLVRLLLRRGSRGLASSVGVLRCRLSTHWTPEMRRACAGCSEVRSRCWADGHVPSTSSAKCEKPRSGKACNFRRGPRRCEAGCVCAAWNRHRACGPARQSGQLRQRARAQPNLCHRPAGGGAGALGGSRLGGRQTS